MGFEWGETDVATRRRVWRSRGSCALAKLAPPTSTKCAVLLTHHWWSLTARRQPSGNVVPAPSCASSAQLPTLAAVDEANSTIATQIGGRGRLTPGDVSNVSSVTPHTWKIERFFTKR